MELVGLGVTIFMSLMAVPHTWSLFLLVLLLSALFLHIFFCLSIETGMYKVLFDFDSSHSPLPTPPFANLFLPPSAFDFPLPLLLLTRNLPYLLFFIQNFPFPFTFCKLSLLSTICLSPSPAPFILLCFFHISLLSTTFPV